MSDTKQDYTNQDLRPCPFCGGEELHEECDTSAKWHWYHCGDCQSTSEPDLGISGAIEKWNTRPLEDALRADLAAAKVDAEKVRNEYLQLEEKWSDDVFRGQDLVEKLRAELAAAQEQVKIAREALRYYQVYRNGAYDPGYAAEAFAAMDAVHG